MGSTDPTVFRFAAISAVKHEYVPLGVAAHPRFEPVVVAEDADQGEWAHERNAQLARELGVPYVRDVEKALGDYGADVAVISSQAERHCDLAVRAADAGLHVIQDKPMSTSVAECDRAVEAVERNGVKFMMWSRNFMPSLVQTRDAIESGRYRPSPRHPRRLLLRLGRRAHPRARGSRAIRPSTGTSTRSRPMRQAATGAWGRSRWAS